MFPWFLHIAVEKSKSVHLFRFDMHSPLMNGACHAIDLPYVFGSTRAMSGSMCPADVEANAKLSEGVMTAWTNFAKTGDPNDHSKNVDATSEHVLPEWPALTPTETHQVMILDIPLSACRIQKVPIHESFPELWNITLDNSRALWFHKAPPKEDRQVEKALVSNL